MTGFGTIHPQDFAPGSVVTDPAGNGLPQIVETVLATEVDTVDAPPPVQEVPNVNQAVGQANSSHSGQMISQDLTIGTDAGKDAPDSAFIAPIMGNVHGTNLVRTGNWTAGEIGYYSVTGTNSSVNPKGGLVGAIGDGTTSADAPVVAVLDGDGGDSTTATAMFKAVKLNSTPGNDPDYGLDLLSEVSGFQPLVPTMADIRMADSVVIMHGAGAPVDGTTGLNIAGTGSLYIDITAGDIYIQTSAITTPAWKLITHA